MNFQIGKNAKGSLLLEASLMLCLVAALWVGNSRSGGLGFAELIRDWEDRIEKLQDERIIYDGASTWRP